MKLHRSIRALLVVILATAAANRVARAQSCARCIVDDTTPHGHIVPAFGLHVGTPQKASVALGVMAGEDWRAKGHDHSRNIALFVEPGISAGRASLSYVDHGFGSFGSGLAIGPSVIRTWNHPWTVRTNTTFVGGDVTLWPIFFVGPRVGVYHGMSGQDNRRWFVSIDFGIGL